MQFDIVITIEDKRYKMHVQRIYEGESVERYEISGGGKSVVFQTNYHYLKKTGSRKKADWKIISGNVKNGVAFALTVRAIEYHFKNEEDQHSYERKK